MFINNNDISYILTDVTKDKDSIYKVCTRMTNTQGHICCNGNHSSDVMSKYIMLRLNKIVIDHLSNFICVDNNDNQDIFNTTIDLKNTSCLTRSFTKRDWNYVSHCIRGKYLIVMQNKEIYINLKTKI